MAIAVTSFPAALDTSASLVAAVNNTSTTLSSGVNGTATTLPVVSATAFPSSGVVLVDSEYISYNGKTSNTLTGCTRGFESSAAVAHSSGATVKFVLTAQMWQAIINAIIALETKLGTGLTAPSNGDLFVGTGSGSSGWRQGAKADVGLSNVDNTSDVNKPVSTLTQTALNAKQDALGFTPVPTTRTVAGKALSTNITIDDADINTSDVTTNNASTTKHGFLRKLSNNASEFMNGLGNWAVPSGGGDMVLSVVQTITGAKTFNDGMLILQHSTSALPAVVPGAILQLSNGKTYVGKPDGSAWAEVLLAGVSATLSVPVGGTGVATLTGIAKGNGTGPFTVAKEVMSWALSDEGTNLTTGVKLTDRVPFAFFVTEVRTSLTTASTSGLVTLNIKRNGTTIFTTQISIDANEKTSVTAVTPAVLSASPYLIADDDELTFDITAAGTGAKGLKVRLIGRQA